MRNVNSLAARRIVAYKTRILYDYACVAVSIADATSVQIFYIQTYLRGRLVSCISFDRTRGLPQVFAFSFLSASGGDFNKHETVPSRSLTSTSASSCMCCARACIHVVYFAYVRRIESTESDRLMMRRSIENIDCKTRCILVNSHQ